MKKRFNLNSDTTSLEQKPGCFLILHELSVVGRLFVVVVVVVGRPLL